MDLPALVVYQVKDTIFWKQITTLSPYTDKSALLFIKSKIQFFESKSQHLPNRSAERIGCLSSQRYNFLKANHNHHGCSIGKIVVVYQVKDTIFWKQITTMPALYWSIIRLFIKSKIQFFESKSQLAGRKYNFFVVVYQVKDTIFWKQITTLFFGLVCAKRLFIKSKIQFFESKSQLVTFFKFTV